MEWKQSVSLSPDDEIGLEDSYLVTMRLCFGFRHVRNKGLGHRAVERGSLVVLAPAEGGISIGSSDDNKRDAGPRVRGACWMCRERRESESAEILQEDHGYQANMT